MLGPLLRAGAAAAALARNPAVRKAIVKGARKIGEAMKNVGRKATQGCKYWKRNRDIRRAYNAAARKAQKDIAAMRKAGKSEREIAEYAHKFRHQQRMKAREQMRKNGDSQSVKDLEARDLKKYGNKDGPDFKQSVERSREQLSKELGRKPTDDEVYRRISDSSTTTDWVTNLKFLTY
jgi:hypothetical protein